jgi:fatty-acyl-CoA synthase
LLEDIERTGATGVVLVPVMLSRVLDAVDEDRAPDLASLRWVFVGGSQLTGPLATRALDTLGDVIYNLYGSTEVSYVSIAGPEHMRRAPDTVGPICRGVKVKILDDSGREQATGHTGRIFVGNAMAFDGYTGGGTKEIIDGLMSTGDVGHLDADGLLFIDGRDDEMIVSGGENVFPREVEELLGAMDEVDEVACIGVDDETFGKRLKAFVVLRDGAKLGAEDVKEHVKQNLARYKVPRDVEFIDELPRNPSGKILKRELA